MLLGEEAGVGETFLEGLFVKLGQGLPDPLPTFGQHGNFGASDDPGMERIIALPEAGIVALASRFIQIPEYLAQRIEIGRVLTKMQGRVS